jgi:hypothetical protein
MASTRNKNTPINYKLEQLQNINNEKYNVYKHSSSGQPYMINLPGNGFGGSCISAEKLSNNYVDIESFLRGTGTTNLERPGGGFMTLTPELNTINPINLYENPEVLMPLPLITSPERPWPI